MFFCLLILLFFPYTSGEDEESAYECGKHGRFEYCIDGIPGCVIGCHCHPGYYFDTDSKICEPNYKLTQDYRRHYLVEPTRLQAPLITSPETEPPTTITSANAIDDKIGEITNDADGLGDWLYNQFFKTIENQVLNNTKDENMQLTRRSGSDPIFKKPSRRSHKYWRSRKKKRKKKGLKNKLLRITEDDSLFDSSSGSDSDDSSGSSTSESESGEPRTNNHGHKKILVVNKRPKMPLPSFIFLPNMDTPFFPPIGLPPPPLPMYPMVPVPPMMVPPYPYPGIPHIHDEDETTTPITSTVPTETSIVTQKLVTNGATTNGHTTVETVVTEPDEEINEENSETPEDLNESTTETLINNMKRSRPKHRSGNRQKLMKQLREKMKRKNKLQNYIANQYQELEPPLLDDDMNNDFLPNPSLMPVKDDINGENLPPGLREIDFKYLTQLIHRENLNKTKQMNMRKPLPPITPPIRNNQMTVNQAPPNRRNNIYDTIYVNQPINENAYKQPPIEPNSFNRPVKVNFNQPMVQSNPNQPSNRPYGSQNNIHNSHMNGMPVETMNNNNMFRQPANNIFNQGANNIYPRQRIEETNDTYYSNLGRQIASMIRNIEGDKEVDIEIEKLSPNPSGHQVFHGNNYGSRSYWERSVRSPFEYMKSFLTEMDKLKKSNENLFSLENEVAMAASTMHTLSLHELENVINEIDKTKSELINRKSSHKPAETSKISFNVNLLPENEHFNAVFKRERTNPITENYPNHLNLSKRRPSNNIRVEDTHLQPELRNILFDSFRSQLPDIINYNPIILNNNVKNVQTTKKPTTIRVTQSIPNKNNVFDKINAFDKQSSINKNNVFDKVNVQIHNNFKSPQKNYTDMNMFDLKPVIINQKRISYFTNNNDQFKFLNDKKLLPIRYPFSNHYESFGQRDSPTYFKPRIRHFDYFDK